MATGRSQTCWKPAPRLGPESQLWSFAQVACSVVGPKGQVQFFVFSLAGSQEREKATRKRTAHAAGLEDAGPDRYGYGTIPCAISSVRAQRPKSPV